MYVELPDVHRYLANRSKAILGITEAFKADSYQEKINLGVGAYRA